MPNRATSEHDDNHEDLKPPVQPAPPMNPAPVAQPEPKVEPMPEPKVEPKVEPAANPKPAPKPEPLDDVFGDPAPKTNPADPKPAPKPEPLDDVFGDPAPKTDPAPKPAVEPKAAPADDIFGEAAPKTNPVSPAEEKVISTEEPAAPAEPKAEEKKPDAKKPEATDPFADPFAAAPALPMREWLDDTGAYRIQGQLIAVLNDTHSSSKVRLLKPTGKTTTVALNRLSAADQAYVQQLVLQYGPQLMKLAAN